MSEITIHCDDLFDGWQWRGPAVVDIYEATITGVHYGDSPVPVGAMKIPTLTPGLIDVGVSASGYADLPSTSNPFAPERAFARMCIRFGVTTIVDINNSLAPLAFLESLSAAGEGPFVLHSAGRLASTPSGRHDITIDVRRVDRTLQWQQDSGAVLASLGAVDPDVMQAVGRRASSRGTPLILSRHREFETPGLVLLKDGGSAPFSDYYPQDVRANPHSADWYFLPQRHAAARWSVDGLLDADDAHLAAPVLPHCRNFARSKGFIGKRMARPIVGRYYGERNPRMLDPDIDLRIAQAMADSRCLASSSAGATGVVPGLSLWSELEGFAGLAQNSQPPTAALTCATGLSARALNNETIGVIEPGRRADLLLFGVPPAHRRPMDLMQRLSSVMIGGRLLDIATLDEEFQDMTTAAMKEPL